MQTTSPQRVNEGRQIAIESRVFSTWAERIETIGRHSIRYGLIVVLLWIGGMKFTSYEAEAISGFVANSPLMSEGENVTPFRVTLLTGSAWRIAAEVQPLQ